MLVTGSMIGSGIFIVSADIARNLGSGGWLLMAWLIAGLMTIMAALSYGELASLIPNAGGQYVYLREAYNPLVAFLYGWSLFAVIQTGTIAAVGVAFAKFTGVFVPELSEKNILLQIGTFKLSAAQLLAIASIVFLTWYNTRGLRAGSTFQTVFTTAKLLALFGLILLGFVFFDSHIWSQNWSYFWTAHLVKPNEEGLLSLQSLTGMSLLMAIGVSMVGTLFSSDAWNNVTFVAGEMKNPSQDVARSMVIGTLIVTGIYILTNIVYLGLLPLVGQENGVDVMERGIQHALYDRVGTAAAHQIFGTIAVFIMAGLIMVSTFGCNNGLILSGSRVYRVMALDGLFFNRAALLNAKGVPAWALWMQCIWASVLCISGRYGDLLDYVVFAVLIFYILTVAGVIILRIKRPDSNRPYRTPFYPFIPLIYIASALIICIILLVKKPEYTWPGLGIVLLGIPLYYFILKKNPPAQLD